MPGGSSGSFGSGSGSGTASASGAGMPSPFSTGSGSGSGGMGGSGGSNSGGFNPMFPGAGMTADGGSGMGMGGGGGGDGSSGSGSGCSGPFCSSTSSQNSGTGSATGSSSGAGMPSPFSTGSGSNSGGMGGSGGSNSGGTGSATGSSSGAGMPSPFSTGSNSGGMGGSGGSNTGGMTGGGAVGGTGSGSKCTGPACSATNGETLLSKIPTVTGAPTGTRCPNTDLCVQTCKYTVKLGPAGSDGCHSCACVMKEETRPQQNLCNKVVQCILNCKTGYEVGNSKDQDGCPSCVCHQPPTPAPTEAPVQSSCDVTTLACMTRCRYGYNIQNAATSQCPVCKCLPAPTTPAPTTRPGVYSVLQNCPAAVHCMTSCSHGYSMVTRPGEACPICTCNTVTVSNVECATPLSCPRGCKVGYKCGTDGCPVCECIRPAEVGASLTSTYLTASLVCSAHFTCINRCPFGYQTGHNGCPSCQCLEPVTGHLSTIGTVSTSAGTENFGHVVQHSVQKWSFSQILKSCQNVLQCVATCTSGFEITAAPAGSCPDCLCKAKTQITTGSVTNAITGSGHGSSQTGIAVVPAAVVVPATEQHIPHLPSLGGSAVTGTGNSIHSAGNNIGNLPSVGAGHGGTGSHGAGGGPMAGATDCLGPACSAPNGLHVLGNGHPKKLSPNQCANVLTCVMTCTYGYKLGAMANNGCPQCECLQ
ncbi:spore coat protein SP96-like [Mizuhopecten yessoensis]|nr:spore coat protein SP96-like [Mizuhopecten yessoensis]